MDGNDDKILQQWREKMAGQEPVRVFFESYVTETADGDFVMVSTENSTIKLLTFPLAESMTVEGAIILARKIRERFPDCFDEDPPPGGSGKRRPYQNAA